MFRALVLLLILPMLLMPPGMCICQFVPIGNVSAASVPAPPDRHPSVGHDSDPRPDCTCDSCCRARAAAVPERGDDQPTQPPSDPGPGKHLPGCPAAVGDVPLNAAVPPIKAQADLVATANFFTPITETLVSRDRTQPVPSRTSSPPLFISHCTLLI